MRALCHGGDSQRVTIKIRVVAKDIDVIGAAVFIDCWRIVNRVGWILNVSYGNGNRCGVSAAVSVRDGIGEGIGAKEVSIRRVAHGVTIIRDRTVIALYNCRDGQGVTIGIGIVSKDANGVSTAVLRNRWRIVNRVRIIINRIDCDVDCAYVGIIGAVVDLEGKAV